MPGWKLEESFILWLTRRILPNSFFFAAPTMPFWPPWQLGLVTGSKETRKGVLFVLHKTFAFLGRRINEPVATPSPCGSLPSFSLKMDTMPGNATAVLWLWQKDQENSYPWNLWASAPALNCIPPGFLWKEKKKKMPICWRYHLSVSEAKSMILAVTSLTFAHYVLIIWNHLL